jgi:predicted short-subunit dehydrogenase-like oxidoreductase (DUF2520 family)
VAGARVLLIAVPDDALAPFAHRLAALGPAAPGGIALHVSGIHPAAALAPLRQAGWSIGAMHPLAVFPRPAPPADLLVGAGFAVAGMPVARRLARSVARLLGGEPFSLATAGRPAYHLAAALVANDTVALFSVALEMARQAGLPPRVARRVLARLLAGTAQVLAATPPDRALTGPVARGDTQTLRRHLQTAGPARDLHVGLSRILVDLAVQAGRLDTATARRLRRVLAGRPSGAAQG